MIGLSCRFGRFYCGLDVVCVKRILAQQFLGFCHCFGAVALLDEAHYLLSRNHVAELCAEAGLAVVSEVGDLRGSEKFSGLKNVRRGRDRLHKHVHRKFVLSGLQRLASAVGEVLGFLGKIYCHF